MKCEYGCNQVGKYNLKNKLCCSNSQNKCPAIREKNSAGLRKAYRENRKNKDSFSDEHRQTAIDIKKEKALQDILSNQANYRANCSIKKIIKENNLLEYKCSACNISTWNNKKITLEIDHIDGNSFNCNLNNLRYMCPNCHSQTSSFRGRGINTGKKKVTDEQLIESIKNSPNIRQALINVNLSPRGGNYARAAKLSLLL